MPNNRWALVIGASNYSSDIGRLRYASDDARSFASVLTNQLGFDAENVKLIIDGGPPEETPTTQHILATLDSLLSDKRLDKANLFTFYFSGHGVGTPGGDYLLPSDSKKGEFAKWGLPVKALVRRIVGAGLKNVLIIADACRAGTENGFGEELNDLCRKANIAVILGCSPGKRSYEYASLGHGAFTHFLLQELRSPEARDQAGALWTSRVGQRLQQKVHDYTEVDHGKYAQTPALWAEASTLDVLLAAYPSSRFADKAMGAFRSSEKRMDRRSFANACLLFAGELYDKGRYDGCVDLLNLVEQLGESTAGSRYNLALSLQMLGRRAESNRLFALMRATYSDLWGDLAALTAQDRTISPRQRIESAKRLFKSSDAWVFRYLAYVSAKSYGSPEECLSMARLLARAPKQKARERLVSQGVLAEEQGRWRDAFQLFESARRASGSFPSNSMIHTLEVQPVVTLGDPNLKQKWVAVGLTLSDRKAQTLTFLADEARSRNETLKRLALLREALKSDPDPDEIVDTAFAAGAYLPRIKGEVAAAARKYPYSWKAYFIEFVVATLGKDEAEKARAGQLWSRYMDDGLSSLTLPLGFMQHLLEESVETKQMGRLAYTKVQEQYFLLLKPYVSAFGYDDEAWSLFVNVGMTAGRTLQILQMLRDNLKISGSKAPSSLRPLLFSLAVNTRTAKDVRSGWNPSFIAPDDASGVGWLRAAFEAMDGKRIVAEKLVRKLSTPTSSLRDLSDALKAYLAASAGRKKAALTLLKRSSDNVAVAALQGLAWALLGDWQRAEPLLRRQTQEISWRALFIRARALKVLDDHYRDTGNWAKHRELVYWVSLSAPGNPLYEGFTFAQRAGVKRFQGRLALDGAGRTDKGDTFIWALTLNIGPDGHARGDFQDDSGEKALLDGTVDGYGNLTGTATLAGMKFEVVAKLAPPSMYAWLPEFRGAGQFLEALGAKANRLAVFEWPYKVKRSAPALVREPSRRSVLLDNRADRDRLDLVSFEEHAHIE